MIRGSRMSPEMRNAPVATSAISRPPPKTKNRNRRPSQDRAEGLNRLDQSAWFSDKAGSRAARTGRVKSPNRHFCWPSISKFSGANHVSNAARNAGHSPSIAANQAVSRLRPFTMLACLKTPSKLNPNRSAACRDPRFAASHFHSNRRYPASNAHFINK